MSFARGRGNKLTGTLEALLRGPESASAALEREIERESRPRPFGGPGKVEMGAADDLLLPLALSAGALAADSSSPRTPSDELGVASAILPAADVPT